MNDMGCWPAIGTIACPHWPVKYCRPTASKLNFRSGLPMDSILSVPNFCVLLPCCCHPRFAERCVLVTVMQCRRDVSVLLIHCSGGLAHVFSGLQYSHVHVIG